MLSNAFEILRSFSSSKPPQTNCTPTGSFASAVKPAGTDDAQTIAVLLENAVPNAVASLSGIDAAFEEDFDGMYVEVTATVGGSDISLSYPAGKAPIAVLRTYLK